MRAYVYMPDLVHAFFLPDVAFSPPLLYPSALQLHVPSSGKSSLASLNGKTPSFLSYYNTSPFTVLIILTLLHLFPSHLLMPVFPPKIVNSIRAIFYLLLLNIIMSSN